MTNIRGNSGYYQHITQTGFSCANGIAPQRANRYNLVMTRCFHAIVHGIVQGVSFRYYTRREAVSLGLRGTVRNLRDGTVEVKVTGEESELKQLSAWLEHGPSYAKVSKLDLTWCEPKEHFDGFSIEH